jgi:hypothetical protein
VVDEDSDALAEERLCQSELQVCWASLRRQLEQQLALRFIDKLADVDQREADQIAFVVKADGMSPRRLVEIDRPSGIALRSRWP